MARTLLLCIALLCALPSNAYSSTITFEDPDGDDYGTYVLTPGAGGGDFIVSGVVGEYQGEQVSTLQFTTYTDGDSITFPTKYCPQDMVDSSGRVYCFYGRDPATGKEDSLRYEGTDAVDELSLGIGDPIPEWMKVTFNGRGGADEMKDDSVINTALRIFDMGPGNDKTFGYGGNDRILGGAGDDVLEGGAGPQELRGGEGNDKLDGDRFSAQWGGDVIDGGPGNDEGGDWYIPSADVHPPVSITQDGVANDGRPDENDNVTSIERISTGGSTGTYQGTDGDDDFNIYTSDGSTSTLLGGNDKFSGSSSPEIVDGGPGHDSLQGGFGHDTITGGPGQDIINGDGGSYCSIYSCQVPFGNDTILAQDGEADQIECGVGEDSVKADAVDTVGTSCEKVERGSVGPGPGPASGSGPAVVGPSAGGQGDFAFRLLSRRSLRGAIRSGVRFQVTCPGACRVQAKLLMGAATLGAGKGSLLKAGTAKVRAKVSTKGKRRLRRLKRATLTLRVSVELASGNTAVFSRRLAFQK